MPTRLGIKYPSTWLGDPPHMLKPDIPVWHRFLDKYGDMFFWYYYDCLLGGPDQSPGDWEDPMKRMWIVNTSLRSDVITEDEKHVYILEVSSDPGLRAIGQVQTYSAAWELDPKISKPLKLGIVASTMQPDFLHACGVFNIMVWLV